MSTVKVKKALDEGEYLDMIYKIKNEYASDKKKLNEMLRLPPDTVKDLDITTEKYVKTCPYKDGCYIIKTQFTALVYFEIEKLDITSSFTSEDIGLFAVTTKPDDGTMHIFSSNSLRTRGGYLKVIIDYKHHTVSKSEHGRNVIEVEAMDINVIPTVLSCQQPIYYRMEGFFDSNNHKKIERIFDVLNKLDEIIDNTEPTLSSVRESEIELGKFIIDKGYVSDESIKEIKKDIEDGHEEDVAEVLTRNLLLVGIVHHPHMKGEVSPGIRPNVMMESYVCWGNFRSLIRNHLRGTNPFIVLSKVARGLSEVNLGDTLQHDLGITAFNDISRLNPYMCNLESMIPRPTTLVPQTELAVMEYVATSISRMCDNIEYIAQTMENRDFIQYRDMHNISDICVCPVCLLFRFCLVYNGLRYDPDKLITEPRNVIVAAPHAPPDTGLMRCDEDYLSQFTANYLDYNPEEKMLVKGILRKLVEVDINDPAYHFRPHIGSTMRINSDLGIFRIKDDDKIFTVSKNDILTIFSFSYWNDDSNRLSNYVRILGTKILFGGYDLSGIVDKFKDAGVNGMITNFLIWSLREMFVDPFTGEELYPIPDAVLKTV